MGLLLSIGILASIAIPSYQTYVTRAKLIETSHFSAAAKLYIWEEYATRAQMPPTNSDAANHVEKMMLSSTMINLATYDRIDLDTASLEVTFQQVGVGADNKTMIFLFETDGTKIEVDCRGGTLSNAYRPPVCQS